MAKRTSTILAVWALSWACKREPHPAPASTNPPPPPAGAAQSVNSPARIPPAAREKEDPALAEIRARFAEIQADQGLIESAFKVACASGEADADVRAFKRGSELKKAELTLNLPGDAGRQHHGFYYHRGRLIFATYSDRTWPLDNPQADPDNPPTREVEVRHYYQGEKPFLCLKKTAEGPANSLSRLIDEAPNQADDCSRARKAQQLATQIAAGPRAKAGLKKLLWKKGYCE